jgi:diguanylate cyclase (GGDEF)-like protein
MQSTEQSKAGKSITRVLVVQSDIVDQILISECFSRSRLHAEIDTAEDIAEARITLAARRYDCVLIELHLSDGSGLTLVRELADPECLYGTPSIIVTEIDNEDTAAEALQEGAQDYLIKSDLTGRQLARAVLFAAERWRLGELLSETKQQLERTVDQLQQANERLSKLARVDSLTGLSNRREFDESLRRLVEEAHRGRQFALIMLDIDHFKHFNDAHGHDVGDALLRAFGGVLTQQSRAVDTIARYGGEEFALLVVDVDQAQARVVAERIRSGVTDGLREFGDVTASFGVGLFDSLRMEGSTLVRAVDAALYEAKARGRDQVVDISQISVEVGPGPATLTRLPQIARIP